MNSPDLFIFACENSADLHGEKLLDSLLQKMPDIEIVGIAGPRMRTKKMKMIMPMEHFEVMGFIDVALALPKLMRHFFSLKKTVLKLNPKAVLFIDYPGFNLRFAASLRKNGYKGKLIHYICPSVWAWGKKRIPLMEKTLDLLLTILPFESKLFASLSTSFVGHPLVKRLEQHSYKELPLPSGMRKVAIFPGSRKKEILRNFRLQLRAAKKLKEKHSDLFFTISLSHLKFLPLLQQIIEEEWAANMNECSQLVGPSESYNQMKGAVLAIAKSGTVTLELAMHKVPTVVTYGISFLDLIIAKHILRIRLPFYCLVNILLEKEVFPELFGPYLTEAALYQKADRFLSDESYTQECKTQCQELKDSLGKENASEKAAEQILKTVL